MDLSWLDGDTIGFLRNHYSGKPRNWQGPYYCVFVSQRFRAVGGEMHHLVVSFGWDFDSFLVSKDVIVWYSMALLYVNIWG